jgi:hypothetical protein
MRGPVPAYLLAHLSTIKFQHKMRVAAALYPCVNVRSGHGSKGHQLKDGRVFAAGNYVSDFSFESYHKEFRQKVFLHLEHLLGLLWRIQGMEKFPVLLQRESIEMIHWAASTDHALRRRPEHSRATQFVSAVFLSLLSMPSHVDMFFAHRALGHIVESKRKICSRFMNAPSR